MWLFYTVQKYFLLVKGIGVKINMFCVYRSLLAVDIDMGVSVSKLVLEF